MGLFSRKPKIKVQSTKTDGFSGWIKCLKCHELIHANELQQHYNCCPKCDYHYRISVEQRIKYLCDKDSFQEMFTGFSPVDPLNFSDVDTYSNRIKKAQEKSKSKEDAVCTGTATIFSDRVAIAILDFNFMGGSMGSIVGEKITRLIEYAMVKRLPFLAVSASGGARMQESILSLMQMAKTAAALKHYNEEKLLFLSILTNPTTGGVTASFASLGNIIIAEPDALIGFAGPRVVAHTIKEKLPEDAQKSEALLDNGMVDLIVSRKNLKKSVSFFLRFFSSPKTCSQNSSQALQELLNQVNTQPL